MSFKWHWDDESFLKALKMEFIFEIVFLVITFLAFSRVP